MKVFVATKNAWKLAELRSIFGGSQLELEAFDGYADVEETGDRYEANALLKARALARQLRDAGISAAALADDSGLEVSALQGRPGVFSARYGGAAFTWPQRRALLLQELRDIEQRDARFVCTIALVEPDGRETIALGTVEGKIGERERGSGGFGYDPIFVYPPRGCTFAELSAQEKNAISHRRRAAKALLDSLRRSASK